VELTQTRRDCRPTRARSLCARGCKARLCMRLLVGSPAYQHTAASSSSSSRVKARAGLFTSEGNKASRADAHQLDHDEQGCDGRPTEGKPYRQDHEQGEGVHGDGGVERAQKAIGEPGWYSPAHHCAAVGICVQNSGLVGI
jgi:hypothetical protein